MTIDESRSDDKLQLNLHGKIDAVSSPELQNEVLKAFAEFLGAFPGGVDIRDTNALVGL